MEYQYIKVPNQITLQECIENDYCLAPSKYSRFLPNKRINFETLSSLCSVSIKKLKINIKSKYHYSEIGDINVSDGSVNSKTFYGLDLPSENPKELKQNDILISTVRTYRGGVGFVHDNNDNHCCSPAILLIREVNSKITKEYLFAVLRTNYFIEQILGFQNRGMYPRLDKAAMNHILIPIPKDDKIIPYVTILVRAYLNKIAIIKKRHEAILKSIEAELLDNQKPIDFTFELPRISEISEVGRLDTNLYRKHFKNIVFKIKNYKNGYLTITDLGFDLSRGQNLQVSNIGKSVYSIKKYPCFYTLMMPNFLSKYGTVDKIEYLGNQNNLKTLKKGDLIFGAEGFEKGRSIVIIEEQDRVITNIHGITIQQKEHDVNKAIFVKCCLDYLRSKGLIDLYAVGGNGGSLAQKYWEIIPFPKFDITKKNEIAKLYHNVEIEYKTDTFTLNNFLDKDNEYNQQAGIYELDKTAKQLKEILNQTIDNIVNDNEIEIKFGNTPT
ncbi:MAG: hypothetical protein NTY74_13810 [Ignavibacteriae bacterium]|nr:hypothetical protein [Ignavibacteriota bacterium]